MKWLYPIVSLFLVFFSLLFLITSLKLGIGNVNDPGPGWMGFLAAFLLFPLSLIIFIKDSLRLAAEKGKGISIDRGALTKLFILIVALCCYSLLLDLIGFLVSTFFLTFVMFYLYSPNNKKWYRSLLIALIITNVTFLLFHKWLQVYLPTGIFRIGW
jgi:putative tricarboxylic transport membrane protein